jgi:hypothetical protein
VELSPAIEAALKQLADSLASAGSPDEEVQKSMDNFRSIALKAVNASPAATELPLVIKSALEQLAGSLENEGVSAGVNPMDEIRDEVLNAVKAARSTEGPSEEPATDAEPESTEEESAGAEGAVEEGAEEALDESVPDESEDAFSEDEPATDISVTDGEEASSENEPATDIPVTDGEEEEVSEEAGADGAGEAGTEEVPSDPVLDNASAEEVPPTETESAPAPVSAPTESLAGSDTVDATDPKTAA